MPLIEGAVSKMDRPFRRDICVASICEPKARILKAIEELNAVPVGFGWTKSPLEFARNTTVLPQRSPGDSMRYEHRALG